MPFLQLSGLLKRGQAERHHPAEAERYLQLRALAKGPSERAPSVQEKMPEVRVALQEAMTQLAEQEDVEKGMDR